MYFCWGSGYVTYAYQMGSLAPLPWEILGVKHFQNRHISKAGISAEWSRMAVGDHSSTAIAQPLLGCGEISRPTCRTFELGPRKMTYKFAYWAYWAYFSKRRYLSISKARNASLSAFIAIPGRFSKIQKLGVGTPFGGYLALNSKFWPQISPPPRSIGGNFGILRCGIYNGA